MEKLSVGSILSIKEEKRFGFIQREGNQSIFFHLSQCREKLAVGDRVIFSVRQSKIREGLNEAFSIRKVHPQPNGYNLVIGKFLRTVDDATPYLLEHVPLVTLSENKKEFIIERKYDHIIGKTLAAKRFKRRGYSRFVEGRQPENSNAFTIVINYNEHHGFYEVSAAFFGPPTLPEPWDRRAKQESLVFWRQHALIPHPVFRFDYDTTKTFDPDSSKPANKYKTVKRS